MGTTAAVSATPREHELPNFTPAIYTTQQPRWKLCRDVMLGAEAVRQPENLNEYFPKGDAETVTEQTARAKRAEFFPMFKETVKGLTGMAFRKDPKVVSPAPIMSLAENIDGSGTALSVFARRVFNDGMVVGHSGILIDVADVADIRSRKKLTKRQAAALGVRPYWIHIRAEQMLNWRTQTINGNVVLTLLVLTEDVEVPSGAFGTVTETRYRVFRRDVATGVISFEIWTDSGDSEEPEFTRRGVLLNQTVIPFVAVYCGERLGPLHSIPPLLDLAYTNVAHVQVLSDLRTSLHFAGNPLLVIKGRSQAGMSPADPNRPVVTPLPGEELNEAYFTEGPGRNAMEVIPAGPNYGIDVDKDGDVKYAEHSGSALGATSKEVNDIETRGAAQGLAMLQRSTRAAQTAEAEAMQRNEKDASLTSAVISMEDALEIALAITAIYLGLETGGTVEMDREFETTVIDTARIQALSSATAAGQFALETFWEMLIKGGILPKNFDMVRERDRLERQAALTLTDGGATSGSGDRKPSTGDANDDVGGGNEGERQAAAA